MSRRVFVEASPPLAIIAPYFFAAPFGLVAAGIIVAGLSGIELGTYNHPDLVALVHTLLLGWLTPAMFGAMYQLGAAVLRSPQPNSWLLRIQFSAHLLGVGALLLAFRAGDLDWLKWAPFLILFSVGAHLWTVQRSFRPSSDWSPTRKYLFASTVMLAVTVLVGAAWAQMLDGGAVSVTPGRILAHAHVGLVGWLAVTVMGVFYQLIPMFMLAGSLQPRFTNWALGLVLAGLLLFFAAGILELGAVFWMPGVLLMAVGCLIWLGDQVRSIRNRLLKDRDLYFISILVSLGFFAATVGLGMAAAWWFAVDGASDTSMRLLFAYFAAGVVGWMGIVLVGNSYKIVPFLVWHHRYRSRAGIEPVPLLEDMYNLALARAVLALHVGATLGLLLAVLVRETPIAVIAGAGMIIAGLAHAASLFSMLLPKSSTRPPPVPRRKPPAPDDLLPMHPQPESTEG